MTSGTTYEDQLSGKWGTGTRLLIAAWLVEIAAAAIGLFIAFLTIYSAREQAIQASGSSRASELQENADAVANAHATYGQSDNTAMQSSLELIEKDLAALDQSFREEIDALEARVAQENEAETVRIAREHALEAERRRGIEGRIDQLRREIRDLNVSEDDELDETIFGDSGVREKFAARRAPLERELESLNKQLETLITAQEERSSSSSASGDISASRSRYDERRKELEARRSEILRSIQSSANKTEASLQPVLVNLENQRIAIVQKYDEQSELAINRFNEQMVELESREGQIRDLQTELQSTRDALQERRTEITHLAKDNQVYRVARWFFDKENAADLTQREINITTLIWFGSLAAITAWTGTLLAFGGLVVKYGHRSLPGPKVRFGPIRRFFRSFRYLAIALRQRAREPKIVTVENEVVKTVEVTKEVPVERVVVKEVPVEVVRKEIVYVPLLTDEDDLIHKQAKDRGGK